MAEKPVAKTAEVTGRSVRDARGQVVRPRAAALDDGKALGMMAGSERPNVGQVARPGDSNRTPTMPAMFVGARTDPKVQESVVMRRRS